MGMRDFFRGRDEDRDRPGRWREEGRFGREENRGYGASQDWRDRDVRDQDYQSTGRGYDDIFGAGSDRYSSGREYGRGYEQQYGSGSDWDRGSQRGYGGQGGWRDYRSENEERSGGQRYSGGFYTGESGRGFGSGQGREGRERGFASSEYGNRGWYGGPMWSSASTLSASDYESRSEGEHRGRGPKGYQRSEERIREDVCEFLSDDPFIDASNIEVSVKNGEVTLSGTVDSREAKRRAADVIENVSGVKDVHNNLRVSTEPSQQSSVGTQAGQTGLNPRH